jgi:hypothetical protein
VLAEKVDDDVEKVALIIVRLVMRAPDAMAAPENFTALAEICEMVLQACDASELPFVFWSAIVIVQALFVRLGAYELPRQIFGIVLEIVTAMNQTALADAIAALAVVDPIIALENECNLLIWVQHTSPAPFLRSIIALQERWAEVPEGIAQRGEMIQNAVRNAVENLRKGRVGNVESEFFDCQALLQAFAGD